MSLEITLEENNINSFQKPMEEHMQKPLKHFDGELIKIRTGRANTALIEDLIVTAYGSTAKLKTLAALSAPEARLLVIQPWDQSIIADIERAIQESDLGVNPVNDGKLIRLQLPEMSGSRREELLKVLGKKLEECKVAIRNIRKDFNNLIRDSKKDKVISEDFSNRLDDVLKKVTDDFIKQADDKAKKKEIEITTI